MDLPIRPKVGITGASGFVGTEMVKTLDEADYACVGFSRNPNRTIKGCVETRRFAPGERPDLSGLEAVVHLAGEPIFGLPTKEKLRRIMESRREGTRTLVDAILEAGENAPQCLVSTSAVGYYGATGEQAVDENSPAGHGFLAEVAQAWEAEALRAVTARTRVVILRFGVIMGDKGGMMRKLGPVFRLGLGATMGNGRQWVSWVDIRDAARLALFAIENPQVRGVLNACSPVPLRNSDFTWALARRFQHRAPLTIPAWFVRLVFGPLSGAFLDSQRVLPHRAEALGFQFEHRGVWEPSKPVQ